MTKPIRNTGLCFHLRLPRQRGQRDVLSHTEFIKVHILHALSLPGHPLRATKKPPTANWWVLLLALPEMTSITINIVPCVKCAPETAARWWGLSRDHNTVTPVMLEPAAPRSQVKQSTTEQLCSQIYCLNYTTLISYILYMTAQRFRYTKKKSA